MGAACFQEFANAERWSRQPTLRCVSRLETRALLQELCYGLLEVCQTQPLTTLVQSSE